MVGRKASVISLPVGYFSQAVHGGSLAQKGAIDVYFNSAICWEGSLID